MKRNLRPTCRGGGGGGGGSCRDEVRELKHDKGFKNKLVYLTMKIAFLHTLHECFSFLYISKPFCPINNNRVVKTRMKQICIFNDEKQ